MHLWNVPLKYSKYIWTQAFLCSFHFDTSLDIDSLDSSNTTERERGSMAAVISKGLCFLCTLMCSYVAWTSWPLLPHFLRTLQSTAEMLVSQLADITRPGTQRHIFHGTSGQLIHKLRQLLPSQGFHFWRVFMDNVIIFLGGKNIGVTDNKAVFKKRRRFTEVQDVITNFGFEFTIELVCKNWESKLAKTSFDMISNCFQLFVPAGFGSTWRCSNVSNYHDSAPLWIGQTWAAKWKSNVHIPPHGYPASFWDTGSEISHLIHLEFVCPEISKLPHCACLHKVPSHQDTNICTMPSDSTRGKSTPPKFASRKMRVKDASVRQAKAALNWQASRVFTSSSPIPHRRYCGYSSVGVAPEASTCSLSIVDSDIETSPLFGEGMIINDVVSELAA